MKKQRKTQATRAVTGGVETLLKSLTSGKGGKNAPKQKLLLFVAAIVLLAVAVVYLNDRFFNLSFIPKWHELYETFGLDDEATAALTDGEIAVHFIDVGQGDCALILAGETSILIDGGESSASSDVIRYLNGLDLDTLDMVVASHPHSDHIGSLSKVIDEFGTETLLMPKLTEKMIPVTRSYERLIESAEKCGAVLEYAEVGARYELTTGCYLDILSPVKDYDDLNNYSILAKLTYGQNSFLFTGDIEQKAERDIYDSGAELSADVIKVAHHGSSTSSLRAFIQAVSPDYAVISVGSPNDYGHPHKETVELLDLLGITVYRTDLDGNIVWTSDGETLSVATSKAREAA
ncbi:MAG: MBL fold metallo-hydrolase [Bacteroides sp.]|nr:MBL fold metallo-hydrolase [Eubacterium sp.]MCM1418275.1 MBL fold metallo-hydrolase [Roseburia sp.]MCM1462342.1 MBL fold metallo-hydrolase [Bacteroides sp.]